MTPHIGRLLEILKEHEACTLAITRLEEEKRQAILTNKPEQIEDIVKREQVLADETQALDRKRVAHSAAVAQRLGLPPEAKVEEIAEKAAGDEAKLLRQARASLRQALLAMRKIMNHNTELLRYSLEHVRSFLGAIATAKSGPGNYRPNGRRESGASSLFNQTA